MNFKIFKRQYCRRGRPDSSIPTISFWSKKMYFNRIAMNEIFKGKSGKIVFFVDTDNYDSIVFGFAPVKGNHPDSFSVTRHSINGSGLVSTTNFYLEHSIILTKIAQLGIKTFKITEIISESDKPKDFIESRCFYTIIRKEKY